MLAISTCPRCHAQVCVPTGIELEALVRCPLCQAEYPLSEALPPALIPVAIRTSAREEDEGLAVEFASTTEGEDAEGFVATPVELGEDLVEADEEDYQIAGHGPDEVLGSFGGVHLEEGASAAATVVARQPLSTSRRRQRPPKTMMQALIGWIVKIGGMLVSGLLACVVAYYGLAYYHGPNFKNLGWPELPLPGIEWLTAPKGADKKVATPTPTASNQPKPTNGNVVAGAPQPTTTPPPQELPAPTVEQRVPVPAVGQTVPVLAPPAPAQVVAPAPAPRPLRPQPGTADYFGPRTPPAVTSDQLGAALDEANTIIGSDNAEELTSSQGHDVLRRLAEAVTYVNGDASDAQLTGRIADAGELLKKLAEQGGQFDELGRLAGEQIDAATDKNAGILLAGVVKTIAKQGRLSGAVVQIAGQEKSINVLTDQNLDSQVDDHVLVLGVVVRNPSSGLVGYSGTKPAVIWAAAWAKAP